MVCDYGAYFSVLGSGATLWYRAEGLTFQYVLPVYMWQPTEALACSLQVKISVCMARQDLCQSSTHSVYRSFLRESKDSYCNTVTLVLIGTEYQHFSQMKQQLICFVEHCFCLSLLKSTAFNKHISFNLCQKGLTELLTFYFP